MVGKAVDGLRWYWVEGGGRLGVPVALTTAPGWRAPPDSRWRADPRLLPEDREWLERQWRLAAE
jgi:hypothetical protein